MLHPPRLRIDGRNVNIGPVDPQTMARFYAAMDDPQIVWRLGIVSAARTKAQQRHLYDGYKAGKPGYNLAANPDWARPDGTYGSRHMVQPDGRSYALDLRLHRLLGWPTAHTVLAFYGLRFPVPGENWHAQALIRFAGGSPVYHDVNPDKADAVSRWLARIQEHQPTADGWAKLAAFEAALRITTLRKGDTGVSVQALQQQLNHADTEIPGHPPLYPSLDTDGIYGARTVDAVAAFQARHGLASDGVCGPKTWAVLLER